MNSPALPRGSCTTNIPKKKKPFVFKAIHRKLILGVFQHYLMPADLLTLLHWSPASQTSIQEELPKLVRHKYLNCFSLLTERGSGSFIYYLGPAGIQYCRDIGKDMHDYWLPKKARLPSYPVLEHTLELNTYLAHAAAFARTRNIGLEIIHDFALRKQPVKVILSIKADGEWIEEHHNIHADAILTFHLPDNTRRWFWHEHDTGEECQKQVKVKLRGLISMLRAQEYRQFGASGITISVTTSGKRFRLEHLRTWTREVVLEQEELTKQNVSGTALSSQAKESQASRQKSYMLYFKFTMIPKFRKEPIDPHKLFQEPVWYPAFGVKPSPLFPA